MGAIYGVIGEIDSGLLQAMGARLSHRGQLLQEWEYAPHIHFGECIHQATPIRLATDNLILVADADIYNASELRDNLSARGQSFASNRVEEIILRGYDAIGAQICEQLIGDFAFAIWDAKRATLLLARDALGSRPLYYWQGNGAFAFASEYKALLALPFVPAKPNLNSIQQLQYTKYPLPNQTLLQDIVSVPAGHYLQYDSSDRIHKQRYWHITLDPVEDTETKHAQALRDQFLTTIERQLGDLTEVGATLSGGVDSAAIVAAIKHIRPDIILHTFTCGYGPDDPEVRSAKIVAQSLGTIHHNIYITPQDIPSLLPQIVWHLEDPIARSETILNYATAQYAAQYVAVVLAGHAGDGLYGGMPRHKIIRLIQRLPFLKTPLAEFYNYTQTSSPPVSMLGKMLHQAYFRGADALPPSIIGASIFPTASPLPTQRTELLNYVLSSGMQNGVTKWLPKVDRTHMAHNLKYRSPFTDTELIQQAFQIPDCYKIRGWREKYIFREAVRPLLPLAILNRPKFPQAMQYDLELSQVIDKLANQYLAPEQIQTRGLFNLADIKRIRQRPSSKAYSSEQAMRLWTAVLVEIWAQTFLDRRGKTQYS